MLAMIWKMHWRNTRSMSESRSSARDVGLCSPYLRVSLRSCRAPLTARAPQCLQSPTLTAQKNKMQAQLLHNLLHGATLPTSRLLERGRIHL
jgi:hypothetical protein